MCQRLNVNTKREIEYGYSIHVDRAALFGWLVENEVPVYGIGTDEWEIEKSFLEDLPPEAFKDIHSTFRGEDYVEIDGCELRELVDELIGSTASDEYAYISWF